MPVLQNVDLTSVSTDREPYPNGEYLMTVKSSELTGNGKGLVIKRVIQDHPEFQDQESWDFINLRQNDGKVNTIGLETVKRYMEAVFGKGSSEAEASPPDTDLLNGHSIRVLLEINEYWPNEIPEAARTPENKKRNNKTKRIFPV